MKKIHLSLLVASLGACAAPHDSDVVPDAGAKSAPIVVTHKWLHTQANHIYDSDGQIWTGRGINMFDTRNCGACLWQQPNVDEVKRRIDVLVDDWGSTFIRLNLESYASAGGRVQWGNVLTDPAYLNDIKAIIDHAASKPNLYVLLSLLVDPTMDDHGIPTDATVPVWKKLAETFLDYPNVIFGITNEPHPLSSDTQAIRDAQGPKVFAQMTACTQAIRAVEDAAKKPHHLVAVQGTTSWSRDLTYYIDHPIASDNVVYEVHPYNPTSFFADMVLRPAKTLPLIIGEFGYWDGGMSMQDCTNLMDLGDTEHIPWMGWAFHWNCGISMLQTPAANACGLGTQLTVNPWGNFMRDRLRATMPATSKTVAFAGNVGFCMDVKAANTTNGTPVQLYTCNGTAAQQWTWGPNQTLRAFGKCLDDAGFVTENGARVILWDCNGGINQRWEYDGASIRLAGTQKCLDIPWGYIHDENELILYDCHDGFNQHWSIR